jgi:hypothetical protein
MKTINSFLLSSGVLLIVAGLGKIVSANGSIRLLAQTDELLGLSYRLLLASVGCIEIVLALYLIFGQGVYLKSLSLTWLATCFISYRLLKLAFGIQQPCSCFGSVTDAIHITPAIADTAIKIILVYLLIGSYGSLFWLWRQHKKSAALLSS